jgi:hypothetical protein
MAQPGTGWPLPVKQPSQDHDFTSVIAEMFAPGIDISAAGLDCARSSTSKTLRT